MNASFAFPVVRRGGSLRVFQFDRLVTQKRSRRRTRVTKPAVRLKPVCGVEEIPGQDRKRAVALWGAWNRLVQEPREAPCPQRRLRDALLVSAWTAAAPGWWTDPSAEISAAEALADPERLRSDLLRSRPYWKTVIDDLVQSGFEEFRILREHSPAPDQSLDPFFLVRFRMVEPLESSERWMSDFLESVVAGLSAAELSDLENLQASWKRFGSQLEGQARSEALQLIQAAGWAGAAEFWMKAIEAEEPDDRGPLIQQIVAHEAASFVWKEEALPLLAMRRRLLQQRNVEPFGFVSVGLSRGIPPVVLQRILENARRHGTPLRFPETVSWSQDLSPRLRMIRTRLPGFRGDELWGRLAEACEGQTEIACAVDSLPISCLTNEELRFAVASMYRISPLDPEKREPRIAALVSLMEEMAGLGARRSDVNLEWLGWLFSRASETELWERELRSGVALWRRYRSLGFRMNDETRDFWERWWDLDSAKDLEVIPTLPDSAFRHLQKAMRTYQRADLIVDGTESLLSLGRRHVLLLFWAHPKGFLSAMRSLGILRKPAREEVLEFYRHHPACGVNPEKAKLADLVILIDALSWAGDQEWVPARLRVHLGGGRRLEERVVRHDRERLLWAMACLQVRAIEEEARRHLDSLASSDSLTWHTRAMVHQIDGNRRSMRRLLLAIGGGETPESYAENHAANREWVARMNRERVPVSVWLRGFEWFATSRSSGNLVLSVEQRSEEVLRMGTYVGSCLALGGCYSESAVAVMLDANKQVVYARRTDDGKVVGRQLLAISRELELVVFPVYPLNCADEIREVMLDYARQFSRHLGIPIFARGESHSEYEIEKLLCGDWYDDGAIAVAG